MLDQKIFKNGENMKMFLESCKETSKLSVDVFWGRWNHIIVTQQSKIKIFFFENLLTTPAAQVSGKTLNLDGLEVSHHLYQGGKSSYVEFWEMGFLFAGL